MVMSWDATDTSCAGAARSCHAACSPASTASASSRWPTAASASYQDETFSGLLVPLYARLRLPGTRIGFDEANEALRDRAESWQRIGATIA